MIRLPKQNASNETTGLALKQTIFSWNEGVRTIDKRFFVEDSDYYYFMDIEADYFEYTDYETIMPFERGRKANFKSIFKWKLRDYQEVIRSFIMDKLKRNITTTRILIELATGKGKTATACETFTKINKRFTILILPKYIDKWIGDINEYIDLNDDDYFVVRGGGLLVKLMEMKKSEVPRIVILSNRTIMNAMKDMRDGTYDEKYPMKLYDLMEHIGSTQLLVDEVHQEFESIYNANIILNPKFTLGLSATYYNDDYKVNQNLKKFFTKENKINPLELDRYRNVISIEFTLSENKKINNINFFTKSYCHNTFEGSLFRRKVILNKYLEMILFNFSRFVEDSEWHRDGKTLIFAGTAKMIDAIIKALKERYPKKDIRRYMGKDPLKNILEADITVTTIGSAGTALDVENLRTVYNTVSMASTNANNQVFGRLREIEGHFPNYIYHWSKNFPSHERHHNLRMRKLGPMVNKWSFADYDIDLAPVSKWGF